MPDNDADFNAACLALGDRINAVLCEAPKAVAIAVATGCFAAMAVTLGVTRAQAHAALDSTLDDMDVAP